MEAVPAHYDAARTHSTTQCPWPPNSNIASRPRPKFRVVLVPDNTTEDADVADANYYDQNDMFESQFYEATTLEDVTNYDDNKDSFNYPDVFNCNSVKVQALAIRKVQTLTVTINGCNEVLTIDSGSEGNCVSEKTCKKLSLPVLPLDSDDRSVPTQADGQSPLVIIGQTEFTAERGNVQMQFKGYVAKTLAAAILCGGPFIEENKLVQELHHNRIIIDGKHTFIEDSPFSPDKLSRF